MTKATQRKIATLEAQLEALKADRAKLFRIYSDALGELVELMA